MSFATASPSQDSIDIDGWRRRIREETFSNYHFEMGVALAANGDHEPAIAQYRQALTIRPAFILASALLADLLRGLGRGGEADEVEERARRLNPDRLEAGWLALVAFHDERGPDGAARAAVDQALAIAPGSAAAAHWRAYLDLKDGVTETTEPSPTLDDVDTRETLAERYTTFANTVLEQGRVLMAERALDRAHALRPEDLEWAERHASVMACVGRFETAADRLDQLAAAAVTTPEIKAPAFPLICRVNIAAGRLDRASALTQAALDAKPDDTLALTHAGLIAANHGDWAMCESRQRAALAINPRDLFALSNLGLAQVGLGRVAEGIETQRTCLATKANDAWALTNLGLALAVNGDEAGAIEAHRAAMHHGGAFLLYNLAQRRWAFDTLVPLYRRLGAFTDIGWNGPV